MKTKWKTTDNWKEFKELVWRYESITLDEVNRASILSALVNDYSTTANKLTGFGKLDTCTLCKAVNNRCGHCMWLLLDNNHCNHLNALNTYYRIIEAPTPEALLQAFKARAKYMRSVAGYIPKFKPSWRNLWDLFNYLKRKYEK